jgi:hypothetical protein
MTSRWRFPLSHAKDIEFEQWFHEVNRYIYQITGGFVADDIPDWKYRDAFDAKVEPMIAAKRAVKAAEASW